LIVKREWKNSFEKWDGICSYLSTKMQAVLVHILRA
jgi:hypothetical protein